MYKIKTVVGETENNSRTAQWRDISRRWKRKKPNAFGEKYFPDMKRVSAWKGVTKIVMTCESDANKYKNSAMFSSLFIDANTVGPDDTVGTSSY